MAPRKWQRERGGVRWVIDTSAIIAGSPDGDYPMTTFERLWEEIESLIVAGAMISSVEVLHELERKDDDLLKWARRFPAMFWESDEGVQKILRRIVNAQPRLLNPDGVKGVADPFVVALASDHRVGVVTQEKAGSLSKPRIPEACHAEGLVCVRLAGLAAKEGWKI